MRRFGAATHQLLRECHPSVSESLNLALKDVNSRSANISPYLHHRELSLVA